MSHAKYTPFEELQFRVSDVYWRWKVWTQLYMGDRANPEDVKERISLMNDMAPSFFDLLQKLLWKDVVQSICKLIDPAETRTKSGLRQNLSLESAVNDANPRLTASAAAEAKKLLSDLRKKSETLRDFRNWLIAHDDLLVATGVEARPEITSDNIEQSMATAVRIMTLLDPNFPKCVFEYGGMIANGDGNSLLQALRLAKKYRTESRAEGQRPVT